jgi:hypothetical protein
MKTGAWKATRILGAFAILGAIIACGGVADAPAEDDSPGSYVTVRGFYEPRADAQPAGYAGYGYVIFPRETGPGVRRKAICRELLGVPADETDSHVPVLRRILIALPVRSVAAVLAPNERTYRCDRIVSAGVYHYAFAGTLAQQIAGDGPIPRGPLLVASEQRLDNACLASRTCQEKLLVWDLSDRPTHHLAAQFGTWQERLRRGPSRWREDVGVLEQLRDDIRNVIGNAAASALSIVTLGADRAE